MIESRIHQELTRLYTIKDSLQQQYVAVQNQINVLEALLIPVKQGPEEKKEKK